MRIILALIGSRGSPAPAPAQTVASLAGTYDGHQMEMGAMLRLTPDGRFDYGLVYGALDEAGQGSWSLKDGKVLLISDAVTPPRFVFLGSEIRLDRVRSTSRSRCRRAYRRNISMRS